MLIDLLKEKWWNRVLNAKLEEKSITINIGTLKPSEAIGRPKKWVFPLMTGREVMIEARIGDACGQAFTDQPAEFTGSIKDVMEEGELKDAAGNTIPGEGKYSKFEVTMNLIVGVDR